jgi:hypothetical protein
VSGQVFISYNRTDRKYVEALAAHLRGLDIRPWYDDAIEPGARFSTVIQREIDASGAFVVVLTPAAASSEWVNREVSYALFMRKPVLPLMLKSCTPPIELIDRHREDVTDGRMVNDRFTGLLRRLLDLSAEDRTAMPAEDRTDGSTAPPATGTPTFSPLAGQPTVVRWPAELPDSDDVYGVPVWSPDSRCLAAAVDGVVRVWGPGNGSTRAFTLAHRVESVAWSPDSRYIACGNGDIATICDPTTGVELLCLGTGDNGSSGAGLNYGQQPLPSVAWSPDGHQLATAGMVQRVWDLHTKAVTAELLSVSDRRATGVLWSPDGRLLATTNGYNAYLWDFDADANEAGSVDARGGVQALAWSYDSRYLAVAAERAIIVHDVRTDAVVATLQPEGPYASNYLPMSSVSWSPDDRYLLAITRGRPYANTYMWDPRPATELDGPLTPGHAVAWSPDGRYLAIANHQRITVQPAPHYFGH